MSTPGTRESHLLSAMLFAARKHSRQRRKDSEGSPYINHPIAVAELLARVGGVTSLEMLQAALLHDTVEDTETTSQELEDHFGPRVRALVAELTDDKSLPKQVRKQLQIDQTPHKSCEAKQIKLCDKICNIGEISATQPADWPLERKREYLDWAERVVAGCRGCHPALEAHFDSVLAERRSALSECSAPN